MDPQIKYHYLSTKQYSNIKVAPFKKFGYLMALIGGAINAGGFFVISRYTSHMSGELAKLADHIYLQDWEVAASSLLIVVSFMLGSCHSAFSIYWATHNRLRSTYALVLILEAVYMLIFGAITANFNYHHLLIPISALLMAFIMGMHNTIVSMLSNGIIRSTHMTGFVTDMGIELGRWFYNFCYKPKFQIGELFTSKFRLCIGIILNFVIGGVIGAWGFSNFAFYFVWPLAIILIALASDSVLYEIKIRNKARKH